MDFLLFPPKLTTKVEDTKLPRTQKIWNQPASNALEYYLLPLPLQTGLNQDTTDIRSCQHQRKESQLLSQAISKIHEHITAQGFEKGLLWALDKGCFFHTALSNLERPWEIWHLDTSWPRGKVAQSLLQGLIHQSRSQYNYVQTSIMLPTF